MTDHQQRPEGALIQRAMRLKNISARQAAAAAGMSDARWRQIMNGYASAGAGNTSPVIGPAETIARMARVVDVTPAQLREAGRDDAADLLLTLAGMQAESDWQQVGSVLDRLHRVREQIEGIIGELESGHDRSDRGTPPQVDVAGAHEPGMRGPQ